MTIAEIYEYAEQIGSMTFSTISAAGDEVYSRIAHFNGYDDDGIYFRTMLNKPYYRQLVATESITVCGLKSGSTSVQTDDEGMASFEPGYSFRLIGKIRRLSFEELREKAKNHSELEMAVKDAERYPTMREANFVIHKAKVEIFDYDFECVYRDHKLLRTRVSFGGMAFNKAGPTITDKCVSCGKCERICTFKAIVEPSDSIKHYNIISERCDDCGTCIMACPLQAIEPSLQF